MGYASHSVEKLGSPFLLVDEMVFTIPEGGEITIEQDQFKLLFMLNGDVHHQLDAWEAPRPFRTGDILICPGFRQHRFLNPDPRAATQLHVLRLFLDGPGLRKQGRKRVRRPEQDLGDFVLHHFTRIQQIPGGIDHAISGCLGDLRRETDRRQPGYRHRVRNLCTDALILVARALSVPGGETAPADPEGASPVVTSAQEYILKNLEKPLTLGEIAWHAGKGEEHLARLFKRETGQSVFDYVREMRMNRAKTYLLDPALSLTRIAELCGFNSLSFFSRTFRDLVGMPPSHYRQHLKTELRPGPNP